MKHFEVFGGHAPKGRYEPGHIIRALRVSLDLRSFKKFESAVVSTADYLDPSDGAAQLEAKMESGEIQHPGPDCLLRSIVRLDVAAMLAHRNLCEQSARFQFLNYDASPHNGLELMNCSESSVAVDQVYGKRFREVDPSRIHVQALPSAALGQGRFGANQKACAVMHQRWCVHGPHVFQLRRDNALVRSTLADMGTEIKIGDGISVVDEVVKQEQVPQEKLSKVLMGRI